MKINKYKYRINNSDLFFFAPEEDSCFRGTIVALSTNEWLFDKVSFKDNDIFIDIGCNIGLVSMTLARLYPKIKIYSFDPNPVAMECFNKSLIENGIINIQTFQSAIGSEYKDNVKFVTYSENETCLVQDGLSDKRNVEYLSNMLCISDLFDKKTFNIDKVKFLKIDIEGGEFSLFDFLFNKRPDILDRIEYLHCEIHPFEGKKESYELREKLNNKFGKKNLVEHNE